MELERAIDLLLKRLFHICRSITGHGTRETLSIIRQYIPLEIKEVPSGTRAFDWTVPKEWNITDAYIKGPDGGKVVDFQENNLHLMSYSVPVHLRMTLDELKPHLYSLPDQPELIPYRTSYYSPNWGFCLADKKLQSFPEGEYEVVIDSKLEDGSLVYGEFYLPGETEDEILLSAYVCHPSMANDNLSGIVLATFLADMLRTSGLHRYSYRFLFAPETIGALVWLSNNREKLSRLRHGLIITCVGDNGRFTYQKSRRGNAEIDRMVMKILHDSGEAHAIVDFSPYGSDERQYSSPGFNLPVGSLMRTMYHRFPQYHTSADNLDFVRGAYIAKTLSMYGTVLGSLERNRVYRRDNPYGEPQLSKLGLYPTIGGPRPNDVLMRAVSWVLNLSDGKHSLLDIAERSGLDFETIVEAAERLLRKGLIVLDELT